MNGQKRKAMGIDDGPSHMKTRDHTEKGAGHRFNAKRRESFTVSHSSVEGIATRCGGSWQCSQIQKGTGHILGGKGISTY